MKGTEAPIIATEGTAPRKQTDEKSHMNKGYTQCFDSYYRSDHNFCHILHVFHTKTQQFWNLSAGADFGRPCSCTQAMYWCRHATQQSLYDVVVLLQM